MKLLFAFAALPTAMPFVAASSLPEVRQRGLRGEGDPDSDINDGGSVATKPHHLWHQALEIWQGLDEQRDPHAMIPARVQEAVLHVF